MTKSSDNADDQLLGSTDMASEKAVTEYADVWAGLGTSYASVSVRWAGWCAQIRALPWLTSISAATSKLRAAFQGTPGGGEMKRGALVRRGIGDLWGNPTKRLVRGRRLDRTGRRQGIRPDVSHAFNSCYGGTGCGNATCSLSSKSFCYFEFADT